MVSLKTSLTSCSVLSVRPVQILLSWRWAKETDVMLVAYSSDRSDLWNRPYLMSTPSLRQSVRVSHIDTEEVDSMKNRDRNVWPSHFILHTGWIIVANPRSILETNWYLMLLVPVTLEAFLQFFLAYLNSSLFSIVPFDDAWAMVRTSK